MNGVGKLIWEVCDLDQNVITELEGRDEGAQVTIGRHVARTASVSIDLDDPAVPLLSVGDQVLRVTVDESAMGSWPAFIGRVLQHDITHDGEQASLKLSAADPLAHLEACLVFGTAGMSPSAETFITYFSNTDPSTIMSQLVATVADNGHGIVDGTLDTSTADVQLGFPAGSTVADALRAIAGLDGAPEFEITPIFAGIGTLAELNTFSTQGTDRSASILLRLGESDEDDELLGFEVAPAMSGVVNRFVLIGDAPEGSTAASSASGSLKDYPLHPASRASHADSIARYGVWETSESASGLSDGTLLGKIAKAHVGANVNPINSYKVTLDPDNAPHFGPQGDFWMGDVVPTRITTPGGRQLDYSGRVASASLMEAESGDVLVDVVFEPKDDASGVTTAGLSVVVDSTEGTDPPPPPDPETDPCAPVADTGGPNCPNAGGKSAKSKKKKGKKKK